MDINGNSTEDPSIAELKDWLFGRVADDNDVVIGGFQLEFVSISRLINHMTCYNSSALIGGEFVLKKILCKICSPV